MNKPMKSYFSALTIMFLGSNLIAQSNCGCPKSLENDKPILTEYQNANESQILSITKIKQLIDYEIVLDSIKDRMHNHAYLFIDQNGSICDITYKTPISVKTETYLYKILSRFKFSKSCFRFTLSLNLDELLRPSEDVVGFTTYEPVLEGCSQSENKQDVRLCMEKNIRSKIYENDLYKKLRIKPASGTVLEFVVNKSGKTTLYKLKKGDANIEMIKKIFDQTTWLPAKKKSGELIAFVYTLHLK
jgi:uncharacterized protein YdeI (BOF family)